MNSYIKCAYGVRIITDCVCLFGAGGCMLASVQYVTPRRCFAI